MHSATLKKIGYITLYYIIAIVLRYYILILKPAFFKDADYFLQILLEGIGPLIGALLMIKVFKRPNELSIFPIGIQKSIVLILIPVILFTLVGIINIGHPYYIGGPKLLFGAILYGAFEEIGWRGYLQAELNGLKKFHKYLIIAILWYVWHLDFGFDIQHLFFFGIILFGTYGMGIVAEKTKSLVLVALFHAFFNLYYIVNSLEGITSNQILIILTISIISILYVMKNEKKSVLLKKNTD